MPSKKNIDSVKTISDKLAKTKSVVFADYRGLSVNQQQKLRKSINEVDGELLVAKNTLLKIAAKTAHYPLEDLADTFTGPTITLFAYGDEIAPLKTLAEFAKDHDLPEIKSGFLNKKPLSAEQVLRLASLPTKVELLSKTTATIKAPLTGFINGLSGNLKNLVFALEAIKNRKGGDN